MVRMRASKVVDGPNEGHHLHKVVDGTNEGYHLRKVVDGQNEAIIYARL